MLILRRLRFPSLPRPRIVDRFRKASDGSAPVEFAIVAIPFFILLFALIEIALAFFASQYLETAAAQAARQIMTGRAQAANFDQSAFIRAVCVNVEPMMNCSGIKVDVQTVANFGAANMGGPDRADGTNAPIYSNTYRQGTGGDIVVVKVYYEWPVMVPTFGLAIGDLPNGKRLLQATAVFRNEPFPTSSTPPAS